MLHHIATDEIDTVHFKWLLIFLLLNWDIHELLKHDWSQCQRSGLMSKPHNHKLITNFFIVVFNTCSLVSSQVWFACKTITLFQKYSQCSELSEIHSKRFFWNKQIYQQQYSTSVDPMNLHSCPGRATVQTCLYIWGYSKSECKFGFSNRTRM